MPAAIIYSRSFLSFTFNKKIALNFKKNALFIIENFMEEKINCSGCAAIGKFSFYKDEEGILIFPFSSFEIKNIKKVEEKNNDKNNGYYYTIYLGYLGKYEKLFEEEGDPVKLIENIPKKSHLADEVFGTDIIEEEYRKIFKRRDDGSGPEGNININSQLEMPNVPMESLQNQENKENKNNNMNKQLNLNNN